MIDWEKYIQWDDTTIAGFFGQYRWLSNFHRCPVWFEGLKYDSSEAAYMAAKTEDVALRQKFVGVEASYAKKLGREIPLRPNWNTIKKDMMLRIVFEKFTANPELKTKLLETGDKRLIERNSWGDKYWGVDCVYGGENHLGEILMKVRAALKE